MFEEYEVHVSKFGEKNTSIDRIDSNKHYCKENCQWATPEVQSRDIIRLITINGETKCLSAWARDFSISTSTVYDRMKRGWSPKLSLMAPFRYKNSLY